MRKRIPTMRVPVPKGYLVMLLRVVHLRIMVRHRMLLLLLLLSVMLLHLHMLQHRRRRRRRNTRIPKLNTPILIFHIHPSIPATILLVMMADSRPHPKLIPILLLLLPTHHKHLHLPTNHHPKAFPPPGLLHPRHPRPIAPLVDLPPQRVRFVFQDPQLPCSEQTVSPRRVDVRDAAVDDGGFGGPPDLCQVREERC